MLILMLISEHKNMLREMLGKCIYIEKEQYVKLFVTHLR